MTIEIYKDIYCRNYTGTEVSGGTDAVIAYLRKKLKRNKCDIFEYCWDKDGECAISFDEESTIERDMEKMLSKVAERISKFGYCRFGCRIGEVVIRDYSNIAFLRKIISEHEGYLKYLEGNKEN